MVNCKQTGKSAANEEQIELVQTAITLHMQQVERTRSRVATTVSPNHIKASNVVTLVLQIPNAIFTVIYNAIYR